MDGLPVWSKRPVVANTARGLSSSPNRSSAATANRRPAPRVWRRRGLQRRTRFRRPLTRLASRDLLRLVELIVTLDLNDVPPAVCEPLVDAIHPTNLLLDLYDLNPEAVRAALSHKPPSSPHLAPRGAPPRTHHRRPPSPTPSVRSEASRPDAAPARPDDGCPHPLPCDTR
jgi:hypothetical protein